MTPPGATLSTEQPHPPQLRRVLSFRDLLLYYIVTGFSLRWVAVAAAAGPSALVIWAIAALGLLLLAIFAIWLAVANAIFEASFGYDEPATPAQFARRVLTTPQGHNIIIVGNAVGFLFAVLAFALSVVSFPLLLDRHVGVAVAIVTSVKAVLLNPVAMMLWAIFVAGLLVIGSLPFFLGLTVVLPVLGHSTWHLYRKVVEADANPRPALRSHTGEKRYAADFPAALFFWRK